MARKRRCRYGVSKTTGNCLKHPRASARRGKASKRKRPCKVWGVLQTKRGPRSACMQYKGAKPSAREKSKNWVSYGPTRQESSSSKPFGPFNPWSGEMEGLRRRRR
jgi:hypothetical protein